MKSSVLSSVRFVFLLFAICLFASTREACSQSYSRLKITTKEGQAITGTKGVLGQESVKIMINDSVKTIPLSDIQSMMSKKGSAWKWALGCGGGCLVGGVILTAMYSGDPSLQTEGVSTGSFFAACVLYAGISAGIGALIGTLTDSWQPVFFGKNAAFIKRFDLKLDNDQRGHVLAGVSFKF